MGAESLKGRIAALHTALLDALAGEADVRFTASEAQDDLDAVITGVGILWGDLKAELAAQERLRRERGKILEAMRDALFVCDGGGGIRTVNDAASALSGYPRAELLGRRFETLFTEPLLARREAVDLSRTRSGEVERWLVTARGEEVPVHITSSLLGDDPRDGTVWVARDLRTLRRLLAEAAEVEAERSRAEELETARRSLETALEDLGRTQDQLIHAQKMEAMGRLTGAIAHDFNNLLVAIMCGTELALDALPPGHEARADLEHVEEAASHARDLTRRLLSTSSRQPTAPALLDLDALVQDSMGMLQRLVHEGIELELRLEGGLWPVFADRSQIHQVLVNLVVNAADAMPSGGRLVIRTRNEHLTEDEASVPEGEYAVLEVTDDGAGMSPETQQKAFDPFFTTKGKGTGLGLATCYGIVSQAVGAITIDSEVGVGTTIRVLLPRSQRRPATVDSGDEALPPRGDGETILMVEDDPLVRATTGRILQWLGYQLLVAVDGRDALARYAEAPFDLVVTDLAMPRMGGEQLASELRHRRPNLPILYVSGYADRYPDVDGADAPTELLRKPFIPLQLAAAVRALLAARTESTKAG